MKSIYTRIFLLCLSVITTTWANAQEWPRQISLTNGDQVKIYQPQPESLNDNQLKFRSAIAITKSGTDPVFGTFWAESNAQTDEGRKTVAVTDVKILDIRFPGETDDESLNSIADAIEDNMSKSSPTLSLDEVQSALNTAKAQQKLTSSFNNNPPKVIYTTRPSILVLIDGTPKLQANSDWGVDAVVNSPFTIVKNNDGRYYLYGGKHWFTASAVTGPYSYTDNTPQNLKKIEDAVNDNATENKNDESSAVPNNSIPEVIVSTQPAELIQTDGEPNFSPVQGTQLLYVKNSSNDIFMDVTSQQYFVLISGRWYKSSGMNNNWQYIPSDQLPADFATIPEGSSKDNVLASVAGTSAADDAVKEAQIPQTAKVDRRTASANITYDGEPEFDRIDGTRLSYAINSSSTVLKMGGRYFAIENGVWFQSGSPLGPWSVSTSRPDDVDLIPPSYPVYNSQYVYIYDATPDYIYMGYTPGYLNTYVYGPTVVYGTGYYYRPWFGHYYYPRPWTWGFNMNYNPWTGWGIGFNYSFGWFDLSFGRSWGYRRGGWWGPAVYRPPFCGNPYRSYGYYGGNYRQRNITYINRNNNIYRSRRDVFTRDNQRNTAFNNRNNYNRGGFNNRSNGLSNGRDRSYNPGNNGNNGRDVNRGGRPDRGLPNNGNTGFGRDRNRVNPNGGNTGTPGNPNRDFNRGRDVNRSRDFNNGNAGRGNTNDVNRGGLPNSGLPNRGNDRSNVPNRNFDRSNLPNRDPNVGGGRTYSPQPSGGRPSQPGRVMPSGGDRSGGGGSRPSGAPERNYGGGGRSSGGGGSSRPAGGGGGRSSGSGGDRGSRGHH